MEERASESAFNSSFSLDSTCSMVYHLLTCRNTKKKREKNGLEDGLKGNRALKTGEGKEQLVPYSIFSFEIFFS